MICVIIRSYKYELCIHAHYTKSLLIKETFYIKNNNISYKKTMGLNVLQDLYKQAWYVGYLISLQPKVDGSVLNFLLIHSAISSLIQND